MQMQGKACYKILALGDFMKINNAVPLRFYGLHFQDGVAEYKDKDPSEMLYIASDTAKRMDKTYQNKPVYVLHNGKAKHDDVQNADGIVVRSFYNKVDGNHWAEFIVYTDAGLKAIRDGWTLSNSYDVLAQKGSGRWHGVDYDYEVADGSYDHLAIVPDPRYSDSIILTPEQFKQYNLDKEAELTNLTNSTGENKMFNLFKKEKVENSADLATMSVVLPESKVEKTLEQIINEADKAEKAKGKPMMANMGAMVKLGNDDEVSVKELLNRYKNMCKKNEEAEAEKKKENEDEEEKKDNEDEKGSGVDQDKAKENEDEDKDNKKNSLEEENKRLSNEIEELKKKNFDELYNAPFKVNNEIETIETSTDQVSRGTSRYGSGN